MLELIDWSWLAVVFGILGGGSEGLNPFSKGFAESKTGGSMQNRVKAPGRMEYGQYQAMAGVGLDQANAIRQGLQQAGGPVNFQSLGLNAQDQASLDQAYSGAESNMRRQAGLLGQDLASTRGLNMSDTPVSEVVMREFLPAMQQLQSEKTQYGLGLGLNMRQLGENARQFNLSSLFGGSQVMPGAGFGLAQMLQQNRFANAGQTWTGYKIGSPLDNMEQGSRIYKNVMDGSGGFMAMSDARLKRDITPVSWRWKDGDTGEQLGVIAQEVAKSHPHLVTHTEDGTMLVHYGALVAMLLSERESLYTRLAKYEGTA